MIKKPRFLKDIPPEEASPAPVATPEPTKPKLKVPRFDKDIPPEEASPAPVAAKPGPLSDGSYPELSGLVAPEGGVGVLVFAKDKLPDLERWLEALSPNDDGLVVVNVLGPERSNPDDPISFFLDRKMTAHFQMPSCPAAKQLFAKRSDTC